MLDANTGWTVGSSGTILFYGETTSDGTLPIAQDTNGSGNEGGTITTTLTATDPDNSDPSSFIFSIVSNPTYITGSVSIATPTYSAGTFSAIATYTHDGSETTSDSFTYQANDGSVDSNTATATITIGPVDDCPEGYDCFGVCGGYAEVDECGVCNGDGSDCDFDCEALVCLSIENVDTDVGTLDILMTNIPGCNYCSDPYYSNYYDCEQYGNDQTGADWIADATMTENSCDDIGGIWFDGHVLAFQFFLKGITITGASGGTAGEYFDAVTFAPSTGNIQGFSFTLNSIPAGSGVLTTISYSNPAEEICFVESFTACAGDFDDDLSTPNTMQYDVDYCPSPCQWSQNLIVISDDVGDGLEIYANWGDCYTPPNCDVALGDVNGDGDISILDLVQIAYYILDLSIPNYECAADYNQDGSVDILDLVEIINIILS